MFFKTIFYVLIFLIMVGLLGKTNYNTSLYKQNQNMLEFIFPVWDWGNPWFYALISSDGLDLQKPDDLKVRFLKEKVEKAEKNKDTICKEKGEDSIECETAEVELENFSLDLENAEEDLLDIIDEKGEEAKLSKKYQKDKYQF